MKSVFYHSLVIISIFGACFCYVQLTFEMIPPIAAILLIPVCIVCAIVMFRLFLKEHDLVLINRGHSKIQKIFLSFLKGKGALVLYVLCIVNASQWLNLLIYDVIHAPGFPIADYVERILFSGLIALVCIRNYIYSHDRKVLGESGTSESE